MGDNKQPEPNALPPDQEEVEEFRRILLSEDIAPIDYVSYGRHVAHIIQRAAIEYCGRH
jgi:hypothetical protein